MKIRMMNILYAGAGFAGGVAARMMISVKVKHEKKEICMLKTAGMRGKSLNEIKRLYKKSRKRVRPVFEKEKKELYGTIPGHYKNTELLSLEEEELVYG
jgi:malic enzyme